jgi:hypothetical protein
MAAAEQRGDLVDGLLRAVAVGGADVDLVDDAEDLRADDAPFGRREG